MKVDKRVFVLLAIFSPQSDLEELARLRDNQHLISKDQAQAWVDLIEGRLKVQGGGNMVRIMNGEVRFTKGGLLVMQQFIQDFHRRYPNASNSPQRH